MKKLTLLIFLALSIQVSIFSQSCLPDGIAFTTQAEIDNFQTNYPGCTEIEGDVNISGNDIINLDGLNVVTSIGGYLNISGNELLNNLTGLENLISIQGGLEISFNYDLFNLTGLQNINAESISNLQITHNNSLSNCNAQSICDYLSSPNGFVRVAYNAPGCNNPSEIANNCGITLPCLPYGEYILYTQTQIDSFQTNYPNCTELSGYVRIRGNISNLNGLNEITRINNLLSIEYNHNLINLSGLENITYLGGFWVWENHSLINLTGISALDSIGSGIWIKDNYSLTNLSGLDSVSSAGGAITIYGNSLLTNLNGLDNIDGASIGSLYLVDNPLLSECAIQSICDYLASPNAYVSINNNASGCNTVEEVEEACETINVPGINIEIEFSIFPNPAKNEIFISGKDIENIKEVNIYNQIGQKVFCKNNISNSINVSMLRQGMYIIELITNDLRVRKKLLIKQNY